MAYLEKNFQTDWGKWWKNRFKKTGAFELKISDGKSLPFNAVEEHQENSMYVAKHGEFLYKPPDNTGYQNPLDSICIYRGLGMLVVMFHAQERNQKKFVMIDIDAWLKEKNKAKADPKLRKSLTLERALEIGKAYSLS